VWGAVVAAGVLAGVVAALRADGLRAAAFAAITTGGAAAIAAVFAVAVVWHRRAERGRATR
jgi:nitrate reductase gamma subunit